jgi:hypothetical protein
MNTAILGDLKARYGDKVLLDPKDLEPALGITVGQQANLRSAGRFPIRTTKVGNKVKVSIYDMADYLSSLCEASVDIEIKASSPVSRAEKKALKGHLEGQWWLEFQQVVYATIERQNLLLKIGPAKLDSGSRKTVII